jgi:exopolysaccharide biosynthesis polyprenyl glycosylphosphotransferase
MSRPYNSPVVAKPALTAAEAASAAAATAPEEQLGAAEDIRSGRPTVLSRSMLRLTVRRAASIASLVFLDLAGLALGLYVALVFRWLYYQHTVLWGVPWKAETEWLPFLMLVMLLVFWRNGLYAQREFRGGVGRIVSSLVLVTVLALAFGLGTGYPFHTFGLAPTALAITALLISLFRASYDVVTKDVLRLTGARRRAILVGKGDDVQHLRQTLGVGRSGIDYEFVGAVAPEADGAGLPVLGWLDSLPAVLARTPVDELIVTDSDFEERELLEIVEQAHRSGVKVRVAPKTTELLTQRAEYVPGQGMPLFELRPPAFAAAQWAAKRTFDVVIGAVIVVLGLPIWIAVAAAIKLTSAGPVFYRDRRVGLGEREFGMLKFRTMYADAADRQAALEAANEAHGPLFKIKNDPRATPVGRILRKYSLDEVPQVLNVLRGEMSLVGPRPLPVRDYVQLEPWHRKRYLVLPGMTGLWQVSGRIELSFDDLVRLDFYYLENWSIWLDITILAKTLPAVLARRGAY